MTLPQAVEAMALAATTDLRGQEVYPDALAFARKAGDLRTYVELLTDWIDRGAHRIDRDGDGRYEDGAAVAARRRLVGSARPRALRSAARGTLRRRRGRLPRLAGRAIGSAFQGALLR